MSALAMPMMALMQRRLASPATLYADLRLLRPEAGVTRLDSVGHGSAAKGAATYIADALADEVMLAAFPDFVFRTANGRIFRLLPQAGSLSVEQGGGRGDGTTDDRDAIQAAIDYAGKVGAREVRFESLRYRIDCPIRTSPAESTRAEDGHPLVVGSSLALRGCAREPSILDFRGVDGADPDLNWQVVPRSVADPSPAVWRGGGLFVQGDPADPAPGPRKVARLELERLVFRGNRTRTGNGDWPADPASGDGWDISDKAFWLQDCHAGTIMLRDVEMTGWRGEIFYLAGPSKAVKRLELDRCRFLTTNGSAFNPGVDCDLLATDCEFGDASQAQEDTAKNRARYVRCSWRDCPQMTFGSGPANGVLYNISYPTRDESAPVPASELDHCRFERIGNLNIASWVRGNIVTLDTTVIVDGVLSQAVRDIDLSIDAWLDQGSDREALILYGPATLAEPVTGAPAGTYIQPPTQVRVTIRHYRTALAAERGHHWHGVAWQGHIARDCVIDVEGEHGHARTPTGGPDPLSMPLVRFWGSPSLAYVPHGWTPAPPITASGSFAPPGPVAVIDTGSDIAVTVALPACPRGGDAFGYAEGQVVRLAKEFDRGSITFAKGLSPSMAMTSSRTLDLGDDWIEFTYNRTRARWEETGFFSAA